MVLVVRKHVEQGVTNLNGIWFHFVLLDVYSLFI